MDSQLLDDYLKHVQQLACRLDSQPGALQELLHFIEISKDKYVSEHAMQEFFKGEYAFYSGYYESALKHYLQCKWLPGFEFFCYLASAHVSRAQGHSDKAMAFAQKALEINPQHHVCLILLGELLAQAGQQEEAQILRRKAQALAEEMPAAKTMPWPHAIHEYAIDEQPAKINISDDEINELVGIFSAAPAEEVLFASEQSQPAKAYSPVCVDLFAANREDETFLLDTCMDEQALERQPETFESATFEAAASRPNAPLDDAMHAFHARQAEVMADYLAHWKARAPIKDYCLYMLQGAENPSNDSLSADLSKSLKWSLLSENTHKPTGGIFLRWQGKGIVINPGKHFLRNFHGYGLHLNDIDFIIVTQESPDAYTDIKEIYDMNYQLNQAGQKAGQEGGGQELHVINYYLNQKAYQALTGILKPRFKQERQALHNLEIFIDSDIEKIELCAGICLHYFLAAPSTTNRHALYAERSLPSSCCLGIRLDLTSSSPLSKLTNDRRQELNVGYISGARWLPSLSRHLGACDVLITGIGNPNSADYNKTAYLEHQLGYFGALSLLKELTPKLLLCTEFGGRNGDIRLEMIKKMRREQSLLPSKCAYTNILPADKGLIVDLKTMYVKCSITGEFVDAKEIHVMRAADVFSRLLYLSEACYL